MFFHRTQPLWPKIAIILQMIIYYSEHYFAKSSFSDIILQICFEEVLQFLSYSILIFAFYCYSNFLSTFNTKAHNSH